MSTDTTNRKTLGPNLATALAVFIPIAAHGLATDVVATPWTGDTVQGGILAGVIFSLVYRVASRSLRVHRRDLLAVIEAVTGLATLSSLSLSTPLWAAVLVGVLGLAMLVVAVGDWLARGDTTVGV